MADRVTVSTGPDVPKAPKVSVIMPAYNTAAFIGEALESVFSQSYSDFEVVVINDGSPDTEQLERVLEPFKNRFVYIVQENRRAAGARNTGIRQARGEYLAFLDSDDWWSPDNLAAQMKMFEEDPSLDMVYADAVQFADLGRGQRTFMEMFPSRDPVNFESMASGKATVCVSCTVARKQIVVKAGLFDESLARCDDYDMWLRIAHVGGRIGFQRRVLARLRGDRPGCLSGAGLVVQKAEMQILTKLDEALPLSRQERDAVQQSLARGRAACDLFAAKACLAKHDYHEAILSLGRANTFLKSAKLTLVLFGLRAVPGLLRAIMLKREQG